MNRRQLQEWMEAVRWLILGPRRFGLAEELAALRGMDESGQPAELRVTDDGFNYVNGRQIQEMSKDDAIQLVLHRRFRPRRIVLRRDLSEWLFSSAVRQAERATNELLRSFREFEDAAKAVDEDEDDATFKWVMAMGTQDDAVWPGFQAVVFAVAAAEGQTNVWADLDGGWKTDGGRDEDELGVVEKVRALARRAGGQVDLSGPPGSWLVEAVEERHRIVHSRGSEHEYPLTGRSTPVPGVTSVTKARRACVGVRAAMVSLSRFLDIEPPRYLAMCPPDPDDSVTWSTAVVTTGLRDDPDFPPQRAPRG